MEPVTWIISGVAFAAVAAARFLFAGSPHARMQVRVGEHLGFEAVSKYEDDVLASAPHVLEGQRGGHRVRLCWSFWLLVPRRSRSFLANVATASAGAHAVPPPRVCVVVDGLPRRIQLVALVRRVADMLRERLGALLTQEVKSGDAALDHALLLWGEPMAALAALDVTARGLLREAAAAAGAGLLLRDGKLYLFAPHPPVSPEAAAALIDAAVALTKHLCAAGDRDPIAACCGLLATDPSSSVRARLVTALATSGDQRGQDAVRAALRDPHPAVRLEAAATLPDAHALYAFVCDLTASDAQRSRAFSTLTHVGDATLIDAALTSASLTGYAGLLIEALRTLADDAHSAEVELTLALNARAHALLSAVIERLSALPPPERDGVIVALCDALSKRQHPDAQALLIAWLEHPSRDVQSVAIEGLGYVGDVHAITAIRLKALQGERRFALWNAANLAIERVRARHPDDVQAGLLALASTSSDAGALSLVKGEPKHIE